jgi:UDP-N-acetylglucosamine acyltransferase
MAQVHPTAVVSSEAVLGEDVEVGPHAVIGPSVTIGAGTKVGAHTRIEGPTNIGERNHFYGHASIGSPPQDTKYRGERTELAIGNDNVIREFVTINRGTAGGGGITTMESHNFLMAYAHVAHDCHVGSHTIFANNATLAGHVEIADHATIGAFSAVHQFCRVGEYAFIGGYTVVTQDALPYVKTVGTRQVKTYGVNSIGLQRNNFSPETIEALTRAYRILVRSKQKLHDALQQIESELGLYPEARYLVAFIRDSQRGFIR